MIGKSASYLVAMHEFRHKTNDISRPAFIDKKDLNPQIAANWDNNLKNWESKHNPVFAPWVAFSQLTDEEFSARAAGIVGEVLCQRGKGQTNQPADCPHVFQPPPPQSARWLRAMPPSSAMWSNAGSKRSDTGGRKKSEHERTA